MAKETRLDDTADIYQPRDERSEREKFKSMSPTERWAHFKQYYLKSSLIGLLILIFVGYFLYSVLSPKPEAILDVAVIDNVVDSTTCETFKTDLPELLSMNPDKQELIIDDSFYLSNSEFSSASVQKLTTYLMAKEIDVIIAPEDTFEHYCKSGYFSNLSDALPTQLFSSLVDNFYYSTIVDEDYNTDGTKTTTESEPAAFGIHLDGLSVKDANGNTISNPVVGIVVNSCYPENAVTFIQYLYDQGYIVEAN